MRSGNSIVNNNENNNNNFICNNVIIYYNIVQVNLEIQKHFTILFINKCLKKSSQICVFQVITTKFIITLIFV